jgi:hypothetical protein
MDTYGIMTGYCEIENELSGFITYGECLDQLSNYSLPI